VPVRVRNADRYAPTRPTRPQGRSGLTQRRGVALPVAAVLAPRWTEWSAGSKRTRGSTGEKLWRGGSPGEHEPRRKGKPDRRAQRPRGGSNASKQPKPPERGGFGARRSRRRGSRWLASGGNDVGAPGGSRPPRESAGVGETRRTRRRASHLRYGGGELQGSWRPRERNRDPGEDQGSVG
jgi:hypothetical protein